MSPGIENLTVSVSIKRHRVRLNLAILCVRVLGIYAGEWAWNRLKPIVISVASGPFRPVMWSVAKDA